MRTTSLLMLLAVLALICSGCRSIQVDDAAQLGAYDVEPYRQALAGSVRDGLVDYRTLRSEHAAALDIYLDAVGRFGPSTTPEQFPEHHDRLAFYLNAYNAIILHQWLDAGAGEAEYESRKVNLFWYVFDRWKVDGAWMSLDTLDRKHIRAKFQDPRVHFALVYGTRSSPPLLDEPYDGARLDDQLDAQGRRWLRDEPDGLVIGDDGVAMPSMIFMWTFDSFRETGGLPAMFERYLEPDDPRLEPTLRGLENGTAQWLPYNLTINDSETERRP